MDLRICNAKMVADEYGMSVDWAKRKLARARKVKGRYLNMEAFASWLENQSVKRCKDV